MHCAAHCLNLVINDPSRVPIVRSTSDIIRETIRFFQESTKRLASLGVNIPLFSLTRWSEKYNSIRIFKANFKLTLDALASLMENASSETRAKALSLKAALKKAGVTYAICLIGRYSELMEREKASGCWSQCTFCEKSYCFSSERPRSRPSGFQHRCI